MSDIDKMRTMLLGKPFAMVTLFNNIVRQFEARLADERKRADDAEESLRAVRDSLPQQEAMRFKTDIKTKGG